MLMKYLLIIQACLLFLNLVSSYNNCKKEYNLCQRGYTSPYFKSNEWKKAYLTWECIHNFFSCYYENYLQVIAEKQREKTKFNVRVFSKLQFKTVPSTKDEDTRDFTRPDKAATYYAGHMSQEKFYFGQKEALSQFCKRALKLKLRFCKDIQTTEPSAKYEGIVLPLCKPPHCGATRDFTGPYKPGTYHDSQEKFYFDQKEALSQFCKRTSKLKFRFCKDIQTTEPSVKYEGVVLPLCKPPHCGATRDFTGSDKHGTYHDSQEKFYFDQKETLSQFCKRTSKLKFRFCKDIQTTGPSVKYEGVVLPLCKPPHCGATRDFTGSDKHGTYHASQETIYFEQKGALLHFCRRLSYLKFPYCKNVFVLSVKNVTTTAPSAKNVTTAVPSAKDVTTTIPSVKDESSTKDVRTSVPSTLGVVTSISSLLDVMTIISSTLDVTTSVPSALDVTTSVPSALNVIPSSLDVTTSVSSALNVIPSALDVTTIATTGNIENVTIADELLVATVESTNAETLDIKNAAVTDENVNVIPTEPDVIPTEPELL
uniref:Leishmanolysin-like peptidase n=1 Tax=Strigamia maritima TaxID=126957 RepID=T1J983_STRMM